MRCVEISRFGPPDVLRLVERPDPAPGPGEVLIRVAAAGVNRPDVMQREGRYPPPPGTSDLPGLEVSGHIAAIGAADASGVPQSASGREWKVGDAVCALVAGGGYAELCTAPAVQCLPAPERISLEDAAGIPETFFTVWTNLFDRGRLAAGEWVLIQGGTSGIGTTAIQLAKARGAHVIATAGTDEKCHAAVTLGADLVVNYRVDDFVAASKAMTDGRGVDVVLDIVGGSYVARHLDCLARDGRLVQIGLQGGSSAEIPLRPLLQRRLTITGSTLRVRTPAEKGAIALAVEREVWPLIARSAVRPIVHARLPLADAAEAHRRLERGDIVGKVVLTVEAARGRRT